MSKGKHLTIAILILVIAGLIGYDVWTIVANGYQSSISWVAYKAAQHYPIIAFALGVVAGHLFWSNGAALPASQGKT